MRLESVGRHVGQGKPQTFCGRLVQVRLSGIGDVAGLGTWYVSGSAGVRHHCRYTLSIVLMVVCLGTFGLVQWVSWHDKPVKHVEHRNLGILFGAHREFRRVGEV